MMLAIVSSRGEEHSLADNFLQKQQKQQKARDFVSQARAGATDAAAGRRRVAAGQPRAFLP